MRLHPRLRPVLPAVAPTLSAAVLLAACSSAPSASKPSSTTAAPAPAPSTSAAAATTTTAAATSNFNSYSVVTSAEAGRAIGQTVSSGVLGTALGGQARACVFYGPSSPTPTDPDVAQADTARVVVVEGPDAATFYNAYKTSANVHPQAVTGYGDEAFYDGSASLSVLTGDAYLRIAVSPPGAPPSLTDEGHLASLILPKL